MLHAVPETAALSAELWKVTFLAKRKNGEGSWGNKTIKGVKYRYFRDTNGKYFYGKTDKEINQKRVKFQEDNLTVINTTCLCDYMRWWLKTIKVNELANTTYDTYEGTIATIDTYPIGKYEISSINQNMLQRFFNVIGEKYSVSTVKRIYMVLNSCLEYAVINEDIPNKPYRKITLVNDERAGIKKKPAKFLPPNEMQKLYEESKRINSDEFRINGKSGTLVYGINAFMLVFIAFTGLRLSEAIALTWENVDLENKELLVKQSAVRIKNRDLSTDENKKYVLKLKKPKTKSGIRTVPLGDIALEMLNNAKQFNINAKETDYVFISQSGELVNRHNLYRTLKSMLVRSGCKHDCNIHGLRHSFGSLLIINGTDIKYVSEVLGHKDISTTYNIYINLTKTQIGDVIRSAQNLPSKKEET